MRRDERIGHLCVVFFDILANMFIRIAQSAPMGKILFSGDADYVKGLNSIWFAAKSSKVRIYAACLLPASYHVVLETSSAMYFNKEYKNVLEMTGGMPPASFYPIHDPDTDNGQDLAQNILYVCRQCKLQSGFDQVMGYPWSTAKLVFNMKAYKNFYSASDLSMETGRVYLPYPHELPDNWHMDERCLIIPDKDVFDAETIEKLFRNTGNYLIGINSPTGVEGEQGKESGMNLLSKICLYLPH